MRVTRWRHPSKRFAVVPLLGGLLSTDICFGVRYGTSATMARRMAIFDLSMQPAKEARRRTVPGSLRKGSSLAPISDRCFVYRPLTRSPQTNLCNYQYPVGVKFCRRSAKREALTRPTTPRITPPADPVSALRGFPATEGSARSPPAPPHSTRAVRTPDEGDRAIMSRRRPPNFRTFSILSHSHIRTEKCATPASEPKSLGSMFIPVSGTGMR